MRDRILHLADLHLGAALDSHLDESARSLLGSVRDSIFRHLSQWILSPDSGIALVLIAGDLFDRHDPPQALEEDARARLAAIAEKVPVIILPGNHDEYSYAQCVYRRQKWPGVLVTTAHPEVVWEGNVGDRRCAVVAAAYQAGKVPPGQKLELPARHEVFSSNDEQAVLIGLFHGTLADQFPPHFLQQERCFWLSHQEAAEGGYDYLALGHFHTRRQWTLGRCLAHYPGPPLGPRTDDPGSGLLSLVRVGDRSLHLEDVPAASMLGCRWAITDLAVKPGESIEDLAARITSDQLVPRDGQNAATLRVIRLSGATTDRDLKERLEATLRARGFTGCLVDGGLQAVVPPDVKALAAEESLVGHFVRRWHQWQEEEHPDDSLALSVLYEGLTALGWDKLRNRGPS